MITDEREKFVTKNMNRNFAIFIFFLLVMGIPAILILSGLIELVGSDNLSDYAVLLVLPAMMIGLLPYTIVYFAMYRGARRRSTAYKCVSFKSRQRIPCAGSDAKEQQVPCIS